MDEWKIVAARIGSLMALLTLFSLSCSLEASATSISNNLGRVNETKIKVEEIDNAVAKAYQFGPPPMGPQFIPPPGVPPGGPPIFQNGQRIRPPGRDICSYDPMACIRDPYLRYYNQSNRAGFSLLTLVLCAFVLMTV